MRTRLRHPGSDEGSSASESWGRSSSRGRRRSPSTSSSEEGAQTEWVRPPGDPAAPSVAAACAAACRRSAAAAARLPPPARPTLTPTLALPQNPYCEACGALDDLDAAPCCASCPNRYHLACLTAAERSAAHVAGVAWACPACTRKAALREGIDCILAARGGGPGRELRLKWKGRSYRAAEWVKAAELDAAATGCPGLRRRLAAFNAKHTRAAALVRRTLGRLAGLGGGSGLQRRGRWGAAGQRQASQVLWGCRCALLTRAAACPHPPRLLMRSKRRRTAG